MADEYNHGNTPDKPIPALGAQLRARSSQQAPLANRLLLAASETLQKRASDRDVEQERTMKNITAAFNAATGHSLTEGDGWTFMMLLKLIRARTGGGFRDDDYIDMAAYAALLGESQAPAGA